MRWKRQILYSPFVKVSLQSEFCPFHTSGPCERTLDSCGLVIKQRGEKGRDMTGIGTAGREPRSGLKPHTA